MTQDDINRMAREAGIPFNKYGLIGCDSCERDIDDELAAFAALIAKAEREACARACDERATEWSSYHIDEPVIVANECAADIRARGVK
jgi:hypothetical protein